MLAMWLVNNVGNQEPFLFLLTVKSYYLHDLQTKIHIT